MSWKTPEVNLGSGKLLVGAPCCGEFRIRKTAMYPLKLTSDFAYHSSAAFSGSANLSVNKAGTLSVQKPLVAPPWGRVGGGGSVSRPASEKGFLDFFLGV